MTDDEVLARFGTADWPLKDWHHRDHVMVAYLFLCRFPFDRAMQRMRTGVLAFNAAHGIVDEPTRGYHETMTHAWMRLVHVTLCEYGPAATAAEFFEQHPELGQKKTLRLFYSRERFMSAQAKSEFVEPDLAPLPRSAKPWTPAAPD